jgi:hypothetical protein
MKATEIASEMERAIPTVTVGGMTLFGVPLPDVVLLATLIYTVLQAYFLLRDKWWRKDDQRKD